MTTAAFRVRDLVQELSRIDTQVREFVAPLSDAQANWQPDGGLRWSVTQNLQHLAKTNRVYVDAMRAEIRTAAPANEAADLGALPGWLGRLFIRLMEPPPRFKVKTRPVVQPPSTGSVREALAEFLASQDGVRAFARDASGDLRAKFKSPFGPLRQNVGTGLLVLAAHDRRHLWQMRQVIVAPDFPAR